LAPLVLCLNNGEVHASEFKRILEEEGGGEGKEENETEIRNKEKVN
jgi:hypothetical protein